MNGKSHCLYCEGTGCTFCYVPDPVRDVVKEIQECVTKMKERGIVANTIHVNPRVLGPENVEKTLNFLADQGIKVRLTYL